MISILRYPLIASTSSVLYLSSCAFAEAPILSGSMEAPFLHAAGLREYRTPRVRTNLPAAPRGAIQGDARDQWDILSQIVEKRTLYLVGVKSSRMIEPYSFLGCRKLSHAYLWPFLHETIDSALYAFLFYSFAPQIPRDPLPPLQQP